jgi:N-acetylmuramoyl-L-alanine amidase
MFWRSDPKAIECRLMIEILAMTLAISPLIVVDAGHGGTEFGARSPAGLWEKELCLSVSKKLKFVLEKQLAARVVLTRDFDVHVRLAERVALANKLKPDVFISIHANSMPTQKQRRLHQGIETYFLSASASGEQAKKVALRENQETGDGKATAEAGDPLALILADLQRAEAHIDSSRLAYAVQESLIAELHAKDRGVQQAPFFVLMGLEAPAILVEIGFVSHQDEGKRLAETAYRDQIAMALARGVTEFLRNAEARAR